MDLVEAPGSALNKASGTPRWLEGISYVHCTICAIEIL